jgi:hypothetical protein
MEDRLDGFAAAAIEAQPANFEVTESGTDTGQTAAAQPLRNPRGDVGA